MGSISKIKEALKGNEFEGSFNHLIAGKRLHFYIKIIPSVLENGISGISIIMKEVTEEKEMERKLNRYSKLLSEITGTSNENLTRYCRGLQDKFIDVEKIDHEFRRKAARNQMILNSMPDLIFVIRKNGTFLDYISSSDKKLFMPPTELLGRKVNEILPEKTSEKMLYCIKQALQTNKVQTLQYQLPINGKLIDYEARFVASQEDEVIAIVTDITERKWVEKHLRDSEEKFRTIFENANDAIFVMNLDGQYLEVNHIAYEQLGYNSKSELLQRAPQDIDTFDDTLQVKDRINQSLQNGHIRFETTLVGKDSSILPVELSLQVINYMGDKAVLGIARDISERKRAEKEILIKEKAIDLSLNPIVFTDLEWNLSYVNHSFLDLWGYADENEVVGQKSDNFWHYGNDSEKVKKTLVSGRSWNGETIARKKDEANFPVYLSSHMIYDDIGNPICLVTSFVDISVIKRGFLATRKLEIEQTMLSISSLFLSSNDIDFSINFALEKICKLCGASRSYVFLFHHNRTLMNNTYEWCSEGIEPQKDKLQDLPVNMFPWLMDKLHSGELINIKDVSALPEEASAKKDIHKIGGIQSLIIHPIYDGGKLAGFIGMDYFRHGATCEDSEFTILRTVSNLIGMALNRII